MSETLFSRYSQRIYHGKCVAFKFNALYPVSVVYILYMDIHMENGRIWWSLLKYELLYSYISIGTARELMHLYMKTQSIFQLLWRYSIPLYGVFFLVQISNSVFLKMKSNSVGPSDFSRIKMIHFTVIRNSGRMTNMIPFLSNHPKYFMSNVQSVQQ